MNINTIKKDLRQLKKTIHIIDALKGVQERYIKRIESLSRLIQTDRIKEQIKTTKAVLALMNIDQYIEEATSLESKYMYAINQLEPIEKAIILDSFVNGMPYWRVGLKLGYTEESLRKKADKIMRKLTSIMQ